MKTYQSSSKTKMASLRLHFSFLIFFVINSILIPTFSSAQICLPRNHAPLFVFGDSLFDAGNNNYINTNTDVQANFPPYGETFFKYPTGRFSDGRVIPDFIAEYAKLPLIQPYLYPGYQRYVDGVNFASSGAGILAETYQGLVIDLKSQLRQFKNVSKVLSQKVGDAETKILLEKAVYLISIGGGDYGSVNTSVASYSREKFVEMVIGNLTSAIEEIHQIGGRKFAFLTIGPVGCTPVARVINGNGSIGPCQEEVTALVELHNNALSVLLQKLEKQLKGFKYSLHEFYDLASDAINNPSKYGFKVGDAACCGSGPKRAYYSCGGTRAVKEYEVCENPNDYLFFDSAHPTDRASEFYAQYMWSGLGNLTGPYNLKELFED